MSEVHLDSDISVWRRVRAGEFELLNDRELLGVGVVLALAAAALLWLLFTTIEPPPPKRLSITTGGTSGAYFAYGQRYAEHFKRHGLVLEVLTSKGSVENLARLSDPQSGIKIGLMQSGIGDPARSPHLESLASVAYEPVWFFYKPKTAPSAPITTLEPLVGQRLAIGPDGSGTRVAALKLLKVNGIDERNARLSDLTGADAVQAVVKGAVDVAVIVASAEAPSVVQAFAAGLEPVSFDRADAHLRLLPWLSKVVLPRGVVSLVQDQPRRDIQLLATSANLVVNQDLHPAIAYLLMDVASDLHRQPTLANGLHEFPSEKSLDFPQSTESQRYFKNGRPFLQRYLPFWLANLLERLAVTLLPALAIVIPLVQLLPKLITWREKSQLLRLYHELELLDRRGELQPARHASAVAHLDRIEATLGRLRLGVNHYIDTYNLRSHLDMLRARLAA